MAGLSGHEIWMMASRGRSPAELNRAAEMSAQAQARIQELSAELAKVTTQMQASWKGKASDQAAQAVQPIEQALQRARETLEQAGTSLQTQSHNYATFRGRVMPVVTPQPPELNLIDHATPWDTDNEIARKEWFEADAHNRRVYAEYVAATAQNTTTLPQPQAPGGAPAANTAVQATGGPAVQAAASAPPQVGDAGATSPSAAGSQAGDKATAPPSTGGDKTSASNAGSTSGSSGVQAPVLPGPGVPKQAGDRTAVADASGLMTGAVPPIAPQSGKDTAHKPALPKGDHLPGGGAPMVPVGIGDPTGTRGQRSSLEPGDRSAVVGRPLSNAPAPAGARGAAGKFGAMGGFAPPIAHAREEEDKEYKRTVYLDEEPDAIVGELPGSVAPVIGEG